jgi:hypothetical protein
VAKEEAVSEIDTDSQSQKPRISRLAITSLAFGVLGPFCFGAMWIVSLLSFHDLVVASPYIMTPFACGVAWILGIVLGMKSLEQIEKSEGQLVGKWYAMAGIFISGVWMVLILAGFLLPALYYVNS